MTEAEWLACDDPFPMVSHLLETGSVRKWCLVAASCWRAWPSLLRAENVAKHLVMTEAAADDQNGPAMRELASNDQLVLHCMDAYEWAMAGGNEATNAALIREAFGNPFRPQPALVSVPVEVVRIAAAAYEERALPSGHLDNTRLAVLSDALEEAGCADADILAHLRSPGPHVRGCWALDLVLGRS